MRKRFSYKHLKRPIKLAISLCYFLVLKAAGLVLRAVGRTPSPRLVILYYHGIAQTYRHDFVRQMQSLRRRALVFPADYHGTLPSGKPNVAITFDDAYVSVA